VAANPYTTNLELQLDARDITGLTDGDSVTTWTDSSAAGNDVTQATSGRRPVYKTNIIGSNPVVRFSGANNKSLYASFASSWSGYSGATVFALLQYNEASGTDYTGIISLSTTAGSDFANGVTLRGEANDAVDRLWGRSVFGLWANSAQMQGLVGALSQGIPVLMGFAIKQGSNGVKIIGPLGISSEIAATQITGTPDEVVIANRYVSGSVNTARGARVDVGMMLLYKEYMSDSNIADVVDWLLTEFDLHTQAAAGSSSILRMPGMTGGMNG